MNPTEAAAPSLTGYYPGVLGQVTELHAVYYFQHWGLDLSFESQVARGLSEFMVAFEPGRDGFWAARADRELAGCIAIDGRLADGEGARLRWFIVSPRYQGRKLGSLLLGEALAFCRQARFPRVYLWTFAGLDTARRLYERSGFQLAEEHPAKQWGRELIEQKFVLELE